MSFSNGPTVVTSGLVLSLDAADRNSYPGSGTTWIDLSGNTYNGTLTNGPTFSTANQGSVVFDGVDDYVSLNTTIPQIIGSSAVTYTAWVKWNSTGLFGTIMGNEALSVSNGLGIRRRSNDTYWMSPGIGINPILITSVPLSVSSNWHMVTSVLTGTLAIQYLNGSQANQTNYTGSITTNSNFRLSALITTSDFFNGNIASAAVYNRALSASEILQNYNATKSRFNL